MQDSIDLFLGNYSVDEVDMTTPLRELKDWKFLTVNNELKVILKKRIYCGHCHFHLWPTCVLVFDVGCSSLFSSSCLSSWWWPSPCASSVSSWLVRLVEIWLALGVSLPGHGGVLSPWKSVNSEKISDQFLYDVIFYSHTSCNWEYGLYDMRNDVMIMRNSMSKSVQCSLLLSLIDLKK